MIHTKCDARLEIIQANQETLLSKSGTTNNSSTQSTKIDSFRIRTDLKWHCLKIFLGLLLIGVVTIITLVIQRFSSASKLDLSSNSPDENCSYYKQNVEDFLNQIKDLKNQSDLQKRENKRLSEIILKKNASIEHLINLQNEINQTTVRLQSLQKNNTEQIKQFENLLSRYRNNENSQKRTSSTGLSMKTSDDYFDISKDFMITTSKKSLSTLVEQITADQIVSFSIISISSFNKKEI